MAASQKKNLFNVLKDSPWWMSAGLGSALFIALEAFFPLGLAFFAALPFCVISVYAGWRQLRTPSEASVAQTLEKVRALSWEEFSAMIEEAFRRDGHRLSAIDAGAADFQMEKGGRLVLLSCKRWKAAQTGVAPLRALAQARLAREAHECIFVSASELSSNAAEFAAAQGVRIVQGAELAKLLAPRLRR